MKYVVTLMLLLSLIVAIGVVDAVGKSEIISERGRGKRVWDLGDNKREFVLGQDICILDPDSLTYVVTDEGVYDVKDKTKKKKGNKGRLYHNTYAGLSTADTEDYLYKWESRLGNGEWISFQIPDRDKNIKVTTDGNKIVYDDIYNGVLLEIESTVRGVKEYVIAENNQGRSTLVDKGEIVWTYVVGDKDGVDPAAIQLALTSGDKVITLSDRNGKLLGNFEVPWMRDDDRNENYRNEYKLTDTTISLVLDTSWLDTASVPILIDPTFSLARDTTSGTFAVSVDCTILENVPTKNYGGRAFNQVQEAQGAYSNKMFIWFDLSPLSGFTVDTAELELWVLELNFGGIAPSPIDFYRMKREWDAGNANGDISFGVSTWDDKFHADTPWFGGTAGGDADAEDYPDWQIENDTWTSWGVNDQVSIKLADDTTAPLTYTNFQAMIDGQTNSNGPYTDTAGTSLNTNMGWFLKYRLDQAAAVTASARWGASNGNVQAQRRPRLNVVATAAATTPETIPYIATVKPDTSSTSGSATISVVGVRFGDSLAGGTRTIRIGVTTFSANEVDTWTNTLIICTSPKVSYYSIGDTDVVVTNDTGIPSTSSVSGPFLAYEQPPTVQSMTVSSTAPKLIEITFDTQPMIRMSDSTGWSVYLNNTEVSAGYYLDQAAGTIAFILGENIRPGTTVNVFYDESGTIAGGPHRIYLDRFDSYAVANNLIWNPDTPGITSIVPDTSSTSGSATLTITGDSFGPTQGIGGVTIGGKTAGILSWSATSIVCTSPKVSRSFLGDTDVIVTNDTGFSNPTGDTITYWNPPAYSSAVVSETSPAIITVTFDTGLMRVDTAIGWSISVDGLARNVGAFACVQGTTISLTIVGTDLTADSTIQIRYNELSGTALGGGGRILLDSFDSVTITNSIPSQTRVININPTAGPLAGGNKFIISGDNFLDPQGAGTCTIDGVECYIDTWTNTRIQGTVPAGVALGSVDVSVRNSDGIVQSIFDGYTYDNVLFPEVFRVNLDHGFFIDTRIFDHSAYNHHGDASSTTVFAWPGLSFDSTVPSYVTFDSPAMLNVTTTMTIEVWVYPEDTVGVHVVISHGRDANDGVYVQLRGGVIDFVTNRSGDSRVTSSTASVQPNKWNHVVVSYGLPTATIFVDGVDQTASQGTHKTPQSCKDRELLLGVAYDKTSYPFGGKMGSWVRWEKNTTDLVGAKNRFNETRRGLK